MIGCAILQDTSSQIVHICTLCISIGVFLVKSTSFSLAFRTDEKVVFAKLFSFTVKKKTVKGDYHVKRMSFPNGP
jgi:hypothetical protein